MSPPGVFEILDSDPFASKRALTKMMVEPVALCSAEQGAVPKSGGARSLVPRAGAYGRLVGLLRTVSAFCFI